MHAGEIRGALRAFTGRAVVALALFIAMGSSGAIAQEPCVGDCNEDGFVRINELILAVNISLGNRLLADCPSIDANGNGTAQINELIRAVNISLAGECPAGPPPTPAPAFCELSNDSSLVLNIGIGPLPLRPATDRYLCRGDVEFEGVDCDPEEPECGAGTCVNEPKVATLEVACLPEDEGNDLTCACMVEEFDPVSIPGIGDVCVAQAEGECPLRIADCDGNDGIDVTVAADHNIGACTGNPNCAATCDTHCAGLEGNFVRQSSGCEGFCSGGSNNGNACTLDSQCPGGSCPGPDGLADGNICECICIETGSGTGTVGGFGCSLGLALTVEADGTGICGDNAPLITLPPLCGELTTGTANGSLANVSNSEMTLTLPPMTGVPSSCQNLLSGQVGGATLVGHLAFFGSAVGDILAENNFICK